MNAFKNKTGEELYSFIDYEQFITNDENYPLLQFNWNVDEPQTMSKYALFYTKIFGNKTVTSQTTYCSANPIFILIEFHAIILLCSIAPGYKVEWERHHLFHTQRTRTSAFTFPSGDCTIGI
jgi:hypothetical protein